MKDDQSLNKMFVGYIHKVMINEKLNYLRNTKKRNKDEIHDENLLRSIQYPNDQMLDYLSIEELKHLEDYVDDEGLSTAIMKLTERQKIIVYKRYIEGSKDPKIGQELGISSQAVSKQRRSAMKKLANHLMISP